MPRSIDQSLAYLQKRKNTENIGIRELNAEIKKLEMIKMLFAKVVSCPKVIRVLTIMVDMGKVPFLTFNETSQSVAADDIQVDLFSFLGICTDLKTVKVVLARGTLTRKFDSLMEEIIRRIPRVERFNLTFESKQKNMKLEALGLALGRYHCANLKKIWIQKKGNNVFSTISLASFLDGIANQCQDLDTLQIGNFTKSFNSDDFFSEKVCASIGMLVEKNSGLKELYLYPVMKSSDILGKIPIGLTDLEFHMGIEQKDSITFQSTGKHISRLEPFLDSLLMRQDSIMDYQRMLHPDLGSPFKVRKVTIALNWFSLYEEHHLRPFLRIFEKNTITEQLILNSTFTYHSSRASLTFQKYADLMTNFLEQDLALSELRLINVAHSTLFHTPEEFPQLTSFAVSNQAFNGTAIFQRVNIRGRLVQEWDVMASNAYRIMHLVRLIQIPQELYPLLLSTLFPSDEIQLWTSTQFPNGVWKILELFYLSDIDYLRNANVKKRFPTFNFLNCLKIGSLL